MFRCAICQETLDVNNIAAVKCGHTFHLACLSQWLQRSKSCPSCRHPVKNSSQDLIEHLYLEYCSLNSFLSTPNTSWSSEDLESRYIALQSNIASLNDEISSLKAQNQDTCDKIEALKLNFSKLENDKKYLQKRFDVQAYKMALLKDRAVHYDNLEEENKRLLLRNGNLQKKIATLENLSKILDGSSDDAQNVVDNLSYADFKETKILLNALKEQLQSTNIKLSKSNEENRKLKNQLKESANENKKSSILAQELREEVKLLRTRPCQTPFNRNLKEFLKDTIPSFSRPIDDANSSTNCDNSPQLDGSFSCSTPKNPGANCRKPNELKNLPHFKVAGKVDHSTTEAPPPFQIPFDDLDSSIPSFDVPILGGLKTRQKTLKNNDENKVVKKPDGLGGRAHFRGQISSRPKRAVVVAAPKAPAVSKKARKTDDNSCIILSD